MKAIDQKIQAHIEAHDFAVRVADDSEHKAQSSKWYKVYRDAWEARLQFQYMLINSQTKLDLGCIPGKTPAPDNVTDAPLDFRVEITKLGDIDDTTPDGKLLMAAIGFITGKFTEQSPEQTIEELNKIAKRIYGRV